MRLSTRLRSWAMRLLGSEAALNLPRSVARARRKIRGQKPTIYYFHQIDDPYSLIMAQQLERFGSMISLDIKPYLVRGPKDAFKGDASRFDEWALRDAVSIAPFLGEPFPTPDGLEQPVYPHLDQSTAANASLLAALDGEHFCLLAQQTCRALWAEQLAPNTSAEAAENVARALDEGDALQKSLGHYQGGTLYFEGEWFWGADRLPRLWERLAAEGFCDAALPVYDPYRNGTAERLTANGPVSAAITLEYYPSLRSPYSAIAHADVERLLSRTKIALTLRPVMPMLMRGVTAPRAKQRYIIQDCAREARANNIPFGHFVDPFGDPVKRGFALFPGALAHGKGMAFVGAYLSAAFAKGIDIDSENGLRQVIANAGLGWEAIQSHPDSDTWTQLLEDNVSAMLGAGLWGVPSFRIRSPGEPDFCCWGQDRIWRVEHELARRSHPSTE